MNVFEHSADHLCAICVDIGTTNTRVWLLHGNKVVARVSRQVGVRDSAHDGTNTALRRTLKELIAAVQNQSTPASGTCAPVCFVAAGMIGSSLGLAELAHIPAPAGLRELAAATAHFVFPDISTLPFLIVPGVRSGSLGSDLGAPHQFETHFDVMRGEETLCVGLQTLGLIQPPAVVLTLGSHWKAIRLAEDGRIQESVTSLSGEMIHAVQTQTILASSIGRDWPNKLAPEWVEAGMAEERRSGLARALFCARLFELRNEGAAVDRFAYLLGAFIACDLDALVARGILGSDMRVVVNGHAAIARAWAFALAQISIAAAVLTEEETEKAFLAGLNRILIKAISISGSTNSSAANPEANRRIKNGRNAAS